MESALSTDISPNTPQSTNDTPAVRRKRNCTHALPFELLSEVFLCLYAVYSDDEHRARDDMLMSLGLVEKYWRDVSVRTLELWTCITWDYTQDGDELDSQSSYKRYVRFRVFLQRSLPFLIDVVFCVYVWDERRVRQEYHSLAWYVLKEKYAARCRSLVLETFPTNGFRFDFPLSNQFRKSEYLSVYQRTGVDRGDLFCEGSSAPLVELRLRRPINVVSNYLTNIRTDLLKCLTIVIGHQTIRSVMNFLSRCHNVQYLDIGMAPPLRFGREFRVPPSDVVRLPSLTWMRATAMPPHEFCSKIKAPRLESLVLDPCFFEGRIKTNPYVWVVTPSPGSTVIGPGVLQELELDCESMPYRPLAGYVIHILEDNPTIQRIRLKQWKRAWHFLSSLRGLLSRRSEAGNEAPRLSLKFVELVECPPHPGVGAANILRGLLASRSDLRVVLRGGVSSLALDEVGSEFGDRFELCSDLR